MKKPDQLVYLIVTFLICLVIFAGCTQKKEICESNFDSENWTVYNPDDYTENDPSIIPITKNSSYTPILRLDSKGFPHIVWCEAYPGTIKYIRWNGENWVCADGSKYDSRLSKTLPANVSRSQTDAIRPYFELDSNDNPHISWTDFRIGGDGYVYYTKWDGENWVCIDNTIYDYNDNELSNPSNLKIKNVDSFKFTLDKTDNPHFVFSTGFRKSDICYVRWDVEKLVCADGTKFSQLQKESYESANVSKRVCSLEPSIVLDSNDYPHIVWQDTSRNGFSIGDIFYIRWNGEKWICADGSPYDESDNCFSNPANISKTKNWSEKPAIMLAENDFPIILFRTYFSSDESNLIFWDGNEWICLDGSPYVPENCKTSESGFVRNYFQKLDNFEFLPLLYKKEKYIHLARINDEFEEDKGKICFNTIGEMEFLTSSTKKKPDFITTIGICWNYDETTISYGFDECGYPHIVWLVDGCDNEGVHYIRWDGKNWVTPK